MTGIKHLSASSFVSRVFLLDNADEVCLFHHRLSKSTKYTQLVNLHRKRQEIHNLNLQPRHKAHQLPSVAVRLSTEVMIGIGYSPAQVSGTSRDRIPPENANEVIIFQT